MTDGGDGADLDLHWVNQYAVPPDQPGGTRHYDLAAELGRRGHKVRLVASDLNLSTRAYSRRRRGRDLRAIDETIDGVEFTWLTAGSYRANDWRRVASMALFGGRVVAHLLPQRTTDGTVFIGSSPQLFAALGTWAAARCKRVPFVFEVRDLWPESYAEVAGKERGFEISLMRAMADLLYRQAARIIVLAEPNADRIAARGVDRQKISYVPNGVDVSSFGEGDEGIDLSTPGVFTFVYAGAHGPANDLETIVRAAHVLEERGRSDIRVVLLGDGPTKPDLRALATELDVSNVDFVDPVPKAQVSATLRSADAGLMVLAPVDLFTYGVSPNKLFDYMGAGLPVLTNVPGLVADIVSSADIGLCVPGGEPTALADGMQELAQAPPPGVAGRGEQFVRDHYDRRVLASRIEDVIRSVAPRRRGRTAWCRRGRAPERG